MANPVSQIVCRILDRYQASLPIALYLQGGACVKSVVVHSHILRTSEGTTPPGSRKRGLSWIAWLFTSLYNWDFFRWSGYGDLRGSRQQKLCIIINVYHCCTYLSSDRRCTSFCTITDESHQHNTIGSALAEIQHRTCARPGSSVSYFSISLYLVRDICRSSALPWQVSGCRFLHLLH